MTVTFRDRELNEFVYVGPGRSCGRLTLAQSLTDLPAVTSDGPAPAEMRLDRLARQLRNGCAATLSFVA